MLQIRPTCENCNRSLAPNSTEAMICSYECTFCEDCVNQILENVCPNCGGGFERRPVRPASGLSKYPASQEITYHPVNQIKFSPLKEKNRKIPPEDR